MNRTVVGRFLIACAALLGVGGLTDVSVSASEKEPTIATPVPTHWQPNTRHTNKCRNFHGSKWKMCDGPRRTPEPYGEDAFLASDLGLGEQKTAQHLLGHAPKPEWIEAVAGKATPTLLWPVENGHFGRGFGYVRKQRRAKRHDGVDIGAPVGELVRAVNDAIVAYSDNGVNGYGNMVMLVHKDGSLSTYCHQRSNYVFAGQQVRRGQVIGEVGVTGITRGPHLHFEWHVRGRPKDPMPRMVGRPTRRNHSPLDSAEYWL